jgi:hypothetical protein
VYNHQIFDSLEAFIDAWKKGTLKKQPSRPDNADDSWSTRKRPAGAVQRDLDHLPGPRSVSFAGLRFRVDRATQYISWLGWGLYLGFDRDMGLSLWDIRFKGERIIYEVPRLSTLIKYAVLISCLFSFHPRKRWRSTPATTPCRARLLGWIGTSEWVLASVTSFQATTARMRPYISLQSTLQPKDMSTVIVPFVCSNRILVDL